MEEEGRRPDAEPVKTSISASAEMSDNTISSSGGESKPEEPTVANKIAFKIPDAFPLVSNPKSNVKNDTATASSGTVSTKPETDTTEIKPEDSTENQENESIETTDKTKQESNSESKMKSNTSSLSPAEQLKNSQVVFPYKEPSWSGLCEDGYQFEVVKNGSIIDNIDLTKKPFYVFGRLPSCDMPMEHPSLSRHHAVMQFSTSASKEREKGWYLYDLDSTHGTWINKNKIRPKVYNRVRVGHVVKFGGSTRLHILQGPEDDQEAESELTVSELKEQNERQKKEAEVLKQADLLEEENRLQKEKQRLEDKGCMWGIDEDAEEISEENPFAVANVVPQHEHLYIDDPKKALKGYFEREGYDLPEYQFAESGHGKHKCMVELPVDTPTGEPVIAEVIVSGKRKDAVVACALEACRLLDKYGELRKSKHESHKKKAKNWEDNDFYDSDEDTFLDRTGTIEKKRQQRMKKAGKIDDKAETYESLLDKHTSVSKEIGEIEAKIQKAKADAAAFEDEEVDALDAYMSAIKSGVMDTKTKMMLKRQLIELKQEETKLRRLVNMAKPASLPELKKQEVPLPKLVAKPAVTTMGKIHKGPRKPLPVQQSKKPVSVANKEDEVEEEEDEDENEAVVSSSNSGTVTSLAGKTKSCDTSHASVPDSTTQSKKEAASRVSQSCDVSSSRVKGPSLPPDMDSENIPDAIKSSEPPKEKVSVPQKRSSTGDDKAKLKKKKTAVSEKYDDGDPNYAVWLPPVGQSGDGKTHLNDKYGY